jgi:HAD superfamily hydrolase (TIGR01509 family)
MKKIIFDFDGTIVNSNEAVIASLNATYFEFKGEMPDFAEVIEPILGKPLEIQIGSFEVDELEDAIDYYRAKYREIRDEKTFSYEGVEPLLRLLKSKNYPMGILSNKGPSGLTHGLEKFGYGQYFDLVVSKDDVTEKKPHVDCFKPVLEGMGGEVSDYIIVGDSTSDIMLGHNLGIPSVLVKWTLLPMSAFEGGEPTYIIDTPLDLLNVIKVIEEKDAH